jgi:cardiolipin synthase
MSDLLQSSLPWWGWALMLIGIVALTGVIGALFLPDWPSPPLTAGFDADPDSDAFVGHAAGVLGLPVHRGGTAVILQNGDAFYSAMLEAIRGARETVNFEVYIFEPDEIGRQFIDVFKERARAGAEVRLLVDWFGAIKLKKRYREELKAAGGGRVLCPLSLRNLKGCTGDPPAPS